MRLRPRVFVVDGSSTSRQASFEVVGADFDDSDGLLSCRFEVLSLCFFGSLVRMGFDSTHTTSSSEVDAWDFCRIASAVLLLFSFFFLDSVTGGISGASSAFASPCIEASSAPAERSVATFLERPGRFFSVFGCSVSDSRGPASSSSSSSSGSDDFFGRPRFFVTVDISTATAGNESSSWVPAGERGDMGPHFALSLFALLRRGDTIDDIGSVSCGEYGD